MGAEHGREYVREYPAAHAASREYDLVCGDTVIPQHPHAQVQFLGYALIHRTHHVRPRVVKAQIEQGAPGIRIPPRAALPHQRRHENQAVRAGRGPEEQPLRLVIIDRSVLFYAKHVPEHIIYRC